MGEEDLKPLVSAPVTNYNTLENIGSEPQGVGENDHKTITTLESIAFMTNTVIGPGLLLLPYTFQIGGILPGSMAVIGFSMICYFVTCSFARLVDDLQKSCHHRLEYVPLARLVTGPVGGTVAFIFLVLSLLGQLLASIVVSAQALDKLMYLAFNWTYGLEFSPEIKFRSFVRSDCNFGPTSTLTCVPFFDSDFVFTFGYGIVTVVTLPFCLMQLRETMIMQVMGFVITTAIVVVLCADFLSGPLSTSAMPLIGPNMEIIPGIIVFNLMLAPLIPSWCNEREISTKPSVVMGWTLSLSVLQFLFLGIVGAARFPNLTGSVLHEMTSEKGGYVMSVLADVFILLMVATGIPEYAVIIRYALAEHMGRNAAKAMMIIPFTVCWALYKESYVMHLLNYTGLLAGSVSSFVLPLLYCAIVRLRSQKQTEGWLKYEGHIAVAILAFMLPFLVGATFWQK